MPEETEALRVEEGKDLLTLVTCTPLGINTHRILLTGERVYPTPSKDVAAAGKRPDVPSFPWWAVALVAGLIVVGLYLWRSGYVAARATERALAGARDKEQEPRPQTWAEQMQIWMDNDAGVEPRRWFTDLPVPQEPSEAENLALLEEIASLSASSGRWDDQELIGHRGDPGAGCDTPERGCQWADSQPLGPILGSAARASPDNVIRPARGMLLRVPGCAAPGFPGIHSDGPVPPERVSVCPDRFTTFHHGSGVRPEATRPSAWTGQKQVQERLGAMAGQKIRIRLKSYDHEVIDSSARKIVDVVTRAGATVVGPVPLPTEKNVFCVIRSPHKYKDSREHFEMRTHKRLIDIVDPTPKAVDSLMRLDLPADVNIEIKL